MKQARDQAAHFLVAFAVLALLLAWPGIFSGAVAGLAMGLIREVTEGGPVTSPGSLLDLAFWTFGGAAAGLWSVS